jgi:hypothetical protein
MSGISSAMKRAKPFVGDLLAVVVLIVLGALLMRGFSERVDINLTDDTGYLTLGLWIQQGVLAGFGPLYSLFFKVLKQVFDDPVDLYDAVIISLSIAPAVGAYVFLRALKIKTYWALLFSGLFLFSAVNMSFITWSRISHYSITIIFLWAAFATRLKDPFHVLMSLFLLTFLLGYVRPEYHLSWYLASGFMMLWWAFVRRFSWVRKELISILPMVLIMGVFLFLIGNPMSGNRTFTAFAQQFSYNYCEWNGLDHYDWIQWMDIAKENFGDFVSLGDAYANNPETFTKHILYNAQQYVSKGLAGVQGIFFPEAIGQIPPALAWLVILSLMLIRMLYVGMSAWVSQARALVLAHRALFLGLIILSVPSLIASIVFYTREHYLVLQMPLVFAWIAIVLHPAAAASHNDPRWKSTIALPLVAALLLIVRPSLADYRTFDVWQEYTYPSNREVIQAVRNLNINEQPVHQLDHEGGFFIYIGKNYKWVNPFNKKEMGFGSYLDSNHINMIYVTKALMSNRHFGNDPEFKALIDQPEAFGFYRLDLSPENKGYLLLSDTLRIQL